MEQTKLLFTKKELVNLTLPLVVEQLLAVTIGIVNTIMVASAGEAAVSGISLVESVNILLINIFTALATGGAVVISQYLGRQDEENAKKAAKQLIYSITALAALIMIVSMILHRGILWAAFGNIDEEVMKNARIYFFISTASFPFLAAYNAGTAIYRSMGNSKISMYISILVNLLNVGGNAIFINGFGLGVAGAATGTLIARACGAVVILKMLHKKTNRVFIDDLLKIEYYPNMIRNILKVGVPTGLENGIFQFGKILVLGMLAGMGTSAIAANAISNTVSTITTIPSVAVGLVLITVVGQCAGARDYQQATFYIKALMAAAYGATITLNLLLFGFLGPVVSIFNLSVEASNIAKDILKFYTISCAFLWPAAFTFPNALRAAGDVRFTMLTSIFSMFAFRIGASYLLAITFHMGVMGIWVGMVIDWIGRITIFFIRYASGKWKKKRII